MGLRLALLTLTAATATAAQCATDASCSLNGRCASGGCRCLSAWSGPTCAILSVQPAVKGAGLHAPHGSDPNTSSWGGSVGYDPVSKRWQMFAAEVILPSFDSLFATAEALQLHLAFPSDGQQLRDRGVGIEQSNRAR